MKTNKIKYKPKRILIIPIVCILYLHFLYIRWNSFEELTDIILPYILFGLSIGLIISTMKLNKPLIKTFIYTVPVPLICYLFEIILNSMLNNNTYAGGPGPGYDISNGIVIALMALGGIPLGLFAVIGCHIGLKLQLLIENEIQNLLKKINESADNNSLRASKITAFAMITVSIITALASILSVLIK